MTLIKKAANAAGGGNTPSDETTLYAEDWNALVYKANQFSPLNFWRTLLVYNGLLTRTSAADNQWRSITWAPELGLFAAVANTGTGNRVMTSPDGITWTIRTSAVDNQWFFITWAPELGLFAAVAFTGTGNRVMTSRRITAG